METFEYTPLAEPSAKSSMRTLVAQFGDGYAQRAADGINGRTEDWGLEFAGKFEEISPIKLFLDRHAGWKSFLWVTPLGDTQHFVTPAGYDMVPFNGIDRYRLTVTFTQNNRLI